MVLSADGDHPMTRLSDTQLVILTAAAQRADLSVLPLPDSLTLKGGALNKVMDSLRNRGLIRVIGGDGGPERVVITSEGMAAIGVEAQGDEAPTPADTAPTAGEADGAAQAAAARSEADDAPASRAGKPARRKAKAPSAKETEAAPGGDPSAKPTPRAGTKQARMIEMLRRPEGATVEQIAEATGWQHHTIRGAISGALKKKLGLTVESIRIREVGPNKTSARGSATVYRITGSGAKTA
jgi:predicted ArsR family transcriptional regulator